MQLIVQDLSLGEKEQKVNNFQIHGQTPHIEYFQTDKTTLELELGKPGLTPSYTVPGGKNVAFGCVESDRQCAFQPGEINGIASLDDFL
jgi:hypothetical protein